MMTFEIWHIDYTEIIYNVLGIVYIGITVPGNL